MKSVLDSSVETIIKKSKFITFAYNINSIKEVNIKLNKIQEDYKDATHVCYAYIINSIEKCSDNGEPSGTAGMPILNVLKKENLNNVLVIVVRYFGGIKLGAGGLVRAYSKACKDSLNIIELKKGYTISLTFDYLNESKVNYYLCDSLIINKEFNDKIIYLVNISIENYDRIISSLNMLCDVKKIKEIYL